VLLQFQAKQLLNLCRFAWLECNRFPFVPLSVWSFNLHQKRNSVTASLSFTALLGRFAIDFPCAFEGLEFLIYIKNKTA